MEQGRNVASLGGDKSHKLGPDVTFGTKWCGIAIAWNAGITARAAVASSWYEQMRGTNGQREISAWDSACGGIVVR